MIEPEPQKKDEPFFKKNKDKIKMFVNRLVSCISVSLLIANIAGATIGAPYIMIPTGIGLIISFLIKAGPHTIDEIKKYFTTELKDDPDKLNDVLEHLSEISGKISSRSLNTNEPVQRTPSEAQETERQNVKLQWNPRTKQLEYVIG